MKKRFFIPVLILCLFLCGCEQIEILYPEYSTVPQTEKDNIVSQAEGTAIVRFFDVGQADCALITVDGASMLIDGGDYKSGGIVCNYLKTSGVTRLDYIVATHPHSDHIGGLADVINAFEVGRIIAPKASHNSISYENMLNAIKNKGLTITAAKAGQEYALGGAKITILSPISKRYDNINQYSVVLRIDYGETSFLFTGDAEGYNEREMIRANANLKANVLKVGHHGSYTSSSSAFIKAVNAEYGVISLGKNNDYGYPHEKVLKRLQGNMKVFRTDECGTITITSDGQALSIQTERGN